MMEFELDQLRANPQWVSLLQTYRCEARRLGEEVDEFDGWLDRITQMDGLDAAELSRAHGRLIAFGFLSASLGSRRSGLRYQVSRAGVGFLAREAGELPAEAEISESA